MTSSTGVNADTWIGTPLPVTPGWVSGEGGTHTVVNPSTGNAIGEVGLASVAETDTAIARVAAAFDGWRAVAPGNAPAAAPVRSRGGRAPRRTGGAGGGNSGHTIGNARSRPATSATC